jgi:hypothetical protein
MLAIVGLGLMWGNWVSMATLTLLWLALVIWRIRFEEAALRLAIITWLSFTPHDCPQPVGKLSQRNFCRIAVVPYLLQHCMHDSSGAAIRAARRSAFAHCWPATVYRHAACIAILR